MDKFCGYIDSLLYKDREDNTEKNIFKEKASYYFDGEQLIIHSLN